MTISSAQLQIDVQERERWRRILSVRVAADAVRQERDRTVKRLAGKLKLPLQVDTGNLEGFQANQYVNEPSDLLQFVLHAIPLKEMVTKSLETRP